MGPPFDSVAVIPGGIDLVFGDLLLYDVEMLVCGLTVIDVVLDGVLDDVPIEEGTAAESIVHDFLESNRQWELRIGACVYHEDGPFLDEDLVPLGCGGVEEHATRWVDRGFYHAIPLDAEWAT